MEKQRTVLKAREKQAIERCNEIIWSFYLMLHVFFKFNNPTSANSSLFNEFVCRLGFFGMSRPV
jgi:hypothetical protein